MHSLVKRVFTKVYEYAVVAVCLIKVFKVLHFALHNFAGEQKSFLRVALCFSIVEITEEL